MSSFDVHLPTLHRTGAGLDDDAVQAASHARSGEGAARDAAGSVGGDPLAAACAHLAAAIETAGDRLRSALELASTTMVSNASRYEEDDSSAASALSSVDFEGEAW